MAIYEFAARCIKVIDGTTVELLVNLGFKVTLLQRFSLIGINTPEANEEKAKARIQSLLIDDVNQRWGEYPLLIHTEESDSGQYLAKVLVFVEFVESVGGSHPQHWVSISEILLKDGLAVEK
jgi:micrococcal nuclease